MRKWSEFTYSQIIGEFYGTDFNPHTDLETLCKGSRTYFPTMHASR